MDNVDKVSIWQSEIESFLKEKFLSWNFTQTENEFSNVGIHSLIPAGKLFRPLLVRAVAHDENNHNLNHQYVEIAMELHHVYTLQHDDLPCMDDDKERRGRASAHIQFNEWKALLSGDSLINLSYYALLNCSSQLSSYYIKYFSWAMGPKGLIYGQVKDLSLEMTNSFKDLIETHKLKTSRLIQSSLVGGYLMSQDTPTVKVLSRAKAYHKLGESIGITFQLLDDLCELADDEVSNHENDVNPFLKFEQTTFNELNRRLFSMRDFLAKGENPNLSIVLTNYFQKILGVLQSGEQNLAKRLPKDNLEKIVASLKALNF